MSQVVQIYLYFVPCREHNSVVSVLCMTQKSLHDLLSISARLKTVFNCMFHNKTPKVFCSTFGVHYNVYATFFFGLTLALMLRIVWRT